jgi:autotransporter-associated beta strand protein
VAKLSGSNTIDTVLTGDTGLAKSGAGELTLATPNFFTGAVTANTVGAVISAAYLADNSSSLGASALNDPTKLVLGNGATLEFTGTTATTTSRSFTVNGSAALAVDAAAAPLTFSSSSIMALDPADSTPDLKLTAFNAGVNRFEAQLSADDIANNRGLANLAIDGTGKWVLGGSANRFKGDVRVDIDGGATLGFESGSLGMGATYASSDIVVANGSTLAWSGSGNTDDISARLQVPAGAIAKLDLGAKNVTFATAPDMGAGASLQKQGSGTLNVSFSAPTLNVAVSSGTLSVNGTLGNISLGDGARLGGAGVLGAVTAAAGSTIAPGNSPGIMTAASAAIAGNTTFLWEVQNAQAGPGVGGYDKMVISGSLDLTGASAGNKITLKINSLTADGVTIGNATNFGPPNGTSSIRTFEFASVQTGASGVLLNNGENISDVFQFDLSQFTYSDGSASNAGLWSIDWNVGTGAITLTAVPEPSTYGFAMGALALAAAAIRRRKRQAKA